MRNNGDGTCFTGLRGKDCYENVNQPAKVAAACGAAAVAVMLLGYLPARAGLKRPHYTDVASASFTVVWKAAGSLVPTFQALAESVVGLVPVTAKLTRTVSPTA